MKLLSLNKTWLSTFKVVTILVALLLMQSMLATTHAQNTTMTEPGAGTWKTWVLTSGSQLRRTAPPTQAATMQEIAQLKERAKQRSPEALALIHYWNAGGPLYRWNEIALDKAVANNMGTGMAWRALSLVHVAAYDATIAAWDSKYAYNRLRPNEVDPSLTTVIPNPTTPSYPSEYTVVAGAASSVLAYLFPNDAALFEGMAEETAQSRLDAGVEYPSDVEAGLELGRQVGAMVIERAKQDGTSAKWEGSVPTEPGQWNGTNPATPLAGKWKPWVLTSGDEFRSDAPYAYDSKEKAAELELLRKFERTPKQTADAFFWEYGAGGLRNHWFWNDEATKLILANGLDNNPPQQARTYALLSITNYDTYVGCFDAKYAYWAIRPFQLDPNFKPLFPTPNHPSYPAAHGCLSAAAARVLGGMFPLDAARLTALATQAGESRIWAGIHYPSDVKAGLALGIAVADKVLEYASKDVSEVALK